MVYLASCQSPATVGKSSIHICEGNPTNLHFLRLACPKLFSFASWAPHVKPWMFWTCKGDDVFIWDLAGPTTSGGFKDFFWPHNTGGNDPIWLLSWECETLVEFWHVDANRVLKIARECIPIWKTMKNLSVEVQMSCRTLPFRCHVSNFLESDVSFKRTYTFIYSNPWAFPQRSHTRIVRTQRECWFYVFFFQWPWLNTYMQLLLISINFP